MFSLAWLHQRAFTLLAGERLSVPLVLPGVLGDTELELIVSLEFARVARLGTDGDAEGSLNGTIVKDFRRAHRGVNSAVNTALELRGSFGLRSGHGTGGPDALRPGITADGGRTWRTGQSSGNFGNHLESGDKSAGTRAAGSTDSDRRRFVQLSVPGVRWNIGLRRPDGSESGVVVEVTSDALTFFVPFERAEELLDLAPETLTDPLVGGTRRARDIRRLMPGGWGEDSDSDSDPGPYPAPASVPGPETVTGGGAADAGEMYADREGDGPPRGERRLAAPGPSGGGLGRGPVTVPAGEHGIPVTAGDDEEAAGDEVGARAVPVALDDADLPSAEETLTDLRADRGDPHRPRSTSTRSSRPCSPTTDT
ncbi:hypothetical protein [Streptomyces sp. NPDC094049]|uniref:hypothetical protein n=1 Tax=Streptomyces sp. NPDC094049 TaxID=3154987 RepID=UPI00331FD689